MMIIKIYSELEGEHVHDRVFVGPDEDHLALAGTLAFRMGEWQSFGAALLLGAERMRGRVKVICKGDDRVVLEKNLSPSTGKP